RGRRRERKQAKKGVLWTRAEGGLKTSYDGTTRTLWETLGNRMSWRPFQSVPRPVSMRRATSSSRIPQVTQPAGAANDQRNARSYSRSKQRLASIWASRVIPASRVEKRRTFPE